MRRLITATILGLMLIPVGCKTSTTPPPLGPGYLNQADQQMGQILSGAHSFYLSIQAQSQTGVLTLDPTTKTAFNAFGVALNSADSIYLAYHNGQATQAAAQAAVNQVQSQQAALPLPGAK